MADRAGHLRAVGVPVTTHVIDRESGQAIALLDQAQHRFGHIRQIRPLVPDAACVRNGDGADSLARPHQRGGKPVVAGLRPEEIPRAHDETAHAIGTGGLHAALQFHADLALARKRLLRGVLAQHGKGVGRKVVHRAGQHNACARCAGRGDGVVDHRQHLASPVLVARRVDGVDDQLGALCRTHHVLAHHCITAHPFEGGVAIRQRIRIALQCTHVPAACHQTPCDFAADATGGAQYQCDALCLCCLFHERAPE